MVLIAFSHLLTLVTLGGVTENFDIKDDSCIDMMSNPSECTFAVWVVLVRPIDSFELPLPLRLQRVVRTGFASELESGEDPVQNPCRSGMEGAESVSRELWKDEDRCHREIPGSSEKRTVFLFRPDIFLLVLEAPSLRATSVVAEKSERRIEECDSGSLDIVDAVGRAMDFV